MSKMLLEFEELYKPYSADANLTWTMKFFEDEAKLLNINPEVRDAAIAEVFLEMANGKTFSVDSCSCSPDCAFNKRPWSAADMNHYTLEKMIVMSAEIRAASSNILNKNINTKILEHIKKSNEEYMKYVNLSWLVNWNRSEVLQILERMVTWKKSWIVKWIT